MPSRVLKTILLSAVAFAVSSPAARAADDGPMAAVQGLFDAGARDDEAAFQRVVAPDFEAYDDGRIYPGASLMTTIEGLHRAGVKIVWGLQPPRLEVRGDLAFAHWINRGSVDLGEGQGPQPMVWLESAALERMGGAWRIRFFQSDRQAAGR